MSVRTLHYYDEIRLLVPEVKQQNGYRLYSEAELAKLQQILFFRELDFSLDEIKAILNNPRFNREQALREQKKLLEIKKERVTRLITTIDKQLLKGGENMSDDTQMFGSFTNKQMEEYKEEAKRRWGDTDAWKQSQERTKHWTKADYDRIAKEGAQWTEKMAQVMTEGNAIDSPVVQEMIDQHYNGLRTFYEPNYEMYKGLGQLYVDDPRFTAFYEKFAVGLAVFMRDAMTHYADKHLSQ